MKKYKLLIGIVSAMSLALFTSCSLMNGNNGNSNSTTIINTPSSDTPSSSNQPSVDPSTGASAEGSSSKSSNVEPAQSSSSATPSSSSSATPSSSSSATPSASSSAQSSQASQSSQQTEYFEVVFTTNSTSVIQTQTVESGQKATEPTAPTKAPTEQYTYTFDKWYTNQALTREFDFNTPVTSNLHLYAKYNSTVNEYRVAFLNDDDTEVSANNLQYGTQIVAPADPTKTETAQYTYTFDGWYTAKTGGTKVTSFSTVRGAVTYYARYTQNIKTFTVTWKNYDGTTLEVDSNLEYNETPIYNGATPVKPETATSRYVFKGWDKEVTKVTADVTYTAVFEEKDITIPVVYYSITWKNGDTVLDTVQVEEGALPNYTGQTPTKAATAEYTYTFNAWSPEVVAASQDATYTATFTETKNKYTYTFYDENGTTQISTDEVEYGTQIVAPTSPTKASTAQYTFTFDGWYTAKTGGTKVTEFPTISGNVEYYARYTSTTREYTITWLNDDNSLIDETTVAYGVTPTHAEPSKTATAQYTYTFTGWTPTVAPVTGVATYTATFSSTTNKYTYTFYDEDGTTTLSTEEVDYGTQIVAPTNPTKDSTVQYTYTFDGWYTSKTGGTKVTEFPTISETVDYYARYAEATRKYTITWLDYDDSIIDETQVNYGETPTHSNPTRTATSEYTYAFNSWDPTITTVTGVATYKATYTATPISSDAISVDTAYSFVNPADNSGDIIITGSWNGSSNTQNKITLDGTSGKLVPNGGNESSHNSYQINAGAVISFSTSQAVKVTVYMWGNGHTDGLYTIVAPGVNSSNTNLTQTYTTTGAGTVTITCTISDYIKRISIEMVDASVVAQSIDVVYTRTAKISNTSRGNGQYKTTNAKTIYMVGDSFDPSGIYATIGYSDSTSEVVDSLSGLSFDGFDSTTTGKKTVTVSFTAGGQTVSETFDVYVTDANPSLVNNVVQVKVNPSYTGNPGTISSGYNMFLTINQALDYLRSLDSTYTNKTKLLYVTSGTYREKLWVDIPNLIIRGANKTNTIIEYDSLFYNKSYDSLPNYKSKSINPDGFENVTDSTQTVTIAEAAENCTIYDITISNYWNSKSRFVDAFGTNSVEHRALALLVYADKVVVQDSILYGYQDTLEVMSGRSYFFESYIYGATDFIFGTNPTILFQKCVIVSIDNGLTDGGYINAFKGLNQNSSDAKTYGVIYDDCDFTNDGVTSSNTALARPWDYYSKVMIMNSRLGSHISKAAYESNATKNKRYVCWTVNGSVTAQPTSDNVDFFEFNNSGDGSLSAQVVGMTLATSSVASNYNNMTIIYGSANGYSDSWTPTLITESQQSTTTITITDQKGYTEGAYAEFTTDADNVLAYYKKSTDSSYTQIDKQLVRLVAGVGRVDMVGLAAGTYTIKLVNSADSTVVSETSNLTVTADDRSGYAHFGYTDGVGAYNDDGTLKNEAKVVYVTDATKNNVDEDGDGQGDGNTLAQILKAATGANPVVVRIIGRISAATWHAIATQGYSEATTSTIKGLNDQYLALQDYNQTDIIGGGFNSLDESTYSKLEGLTNKIKYDSSKKEFDSYYNMLDIDGARNVTVEGIGEDAEIYQWGLTWKRSNSIEVKNITFTNYPEDACSFEGNKITVNATATSYDASTIGYSNYWVHNCTFNRGNNVWDVSSEHDKGDGDGATDFKYCKDVTLSYCHYVDTHKTGLIGGSSGDVTANMTFHHNWYENCKSRMPYARQANIHAYNNYYDCSTGTTMQIYAGAYAFIENCYFKNDNKTFDVKANSYQNAAVKSYNNIFDGSNSYNVSNVTIVTNRTDSVSNGNIFDTDFDVDSTSFYYDSTNNKSDVQIMNTASELPTELPKFAGAGLSPVIEGTSIGGGSGSSDPVGKPDNVNITFGTAGNYTTITTLDISNAQINTFNGDNSLFYGGDMVLSVEAGATVTINGYGGGLTAYHVTTNGSVSGTQTDDYEVVVTSAGDVIITSESTNNYFISITVTY